MTLRILVPVAVLVASALVPMAVSLERAFACSWIPLSAAAFAEHESVMVVGEVSEATDDVAPVDVQEVLAGSLDNSRIRVNNHRTVCPAGIGKGPGGQLQDGDRVVLALRPDRWGEVEWGPAGIEGNGVFVRGEDDLYTDGYNDPATLDAIRAEVAAVAGPPTSVEPAPTVAPATPTPIATPAPGETGSGQATEPEGGTDVTTAVIAIVLVAAVVSTVALGVRRR